MPTIRTDKRAYSRSTSDAARIQATIAGLTNTNPLTVTLVRNDGYGAVQQQTITPIGTTAAFTIDLETVAADGLNYHRSGRYTIEARADDQSLVASSAAIDVRPLPVDVFVSTYLFGIPLYAEAMLQPVAQPTINGVRVGYVDPGMYKGPGLLAYDPGDGFSWRGGRAVALDGTDAIQYLQVLTPEGDAYLELEVDPTLLPDVAAESNLLIDQWRLRPIDLVRYLDDAYDWVQAKLHTQLETTIITTDAANPHTESGWYDAVVSPQDYERGADRTFSLGDARARPLQRLLWLAGYYVAQPTITFPSDWFTIEPRAAIVTLVPIAGSITTVHPVWSAWAVGMRQLPYVPNYWHFSAVSGLQDLRGDRAPLVEAIGKKAALDVLRDLSLAATTGRTSRSASREGVSESWNYSGGAYGEKITAYQQWLDTQIPRLYQRHAGFAVSTVL